MKRTERNFYWVFTEQRDYTTPSLKYRNNKIKFRNQHFMNNSFTQVIFPFFCELFWG